MRARLLLALAALSLLLYNIRDHLSQLGEVARTYATFHSLLRHHPELLYRYDTSSTQPRDNSTTTTTTESLDDDAQDTLTAAGGGSSSSSAAVTTTTTTTTTIPRIMHQIALGSANVSKHAAAMASCRAMHPTWEHKLWTDANASDFIADNYPWVLPHYTRYPQQIQRANVLRYALLHAMGGVYLDLDVACLAPLDDTPLVRLPFVSPGAYPAGVNNAFIAARPGHAFLRLLVDAVPRHDMFWGLPMRVPYVENMLSTGCMFFSNRWMSFVRRRLRHGEGGGGGIVDVNTDNDDDPDRVYILADEAGDMAAHMLRGKVTTPLFAHGGASSWHSWDAALIILIGKHYFIFGALLAALAAAAASMLVCACAGRQGRCRRKGGLLSRLTRTSWKVVGARSSAAADKESWV
ncbi:glycosyltransferase family 32 protein [Purpureocillium lavendulum]|uniref:Glycosyltransferase family 32 protein n=1 Tax=Purpureocillium lavendulum TaxID=1247861 RepID=A0AB34FHH0_9HYPO|nr:glycosyltransferase family 32 protein [Purpureocillium lavendulum]